MLICNYNGKWDHLRKHNIWCYFDNKNVLQALYERFERQKQRESERITAQEQRTQRKEGGRKARDRATKKIA